MKRSITTAIECIKLRHAYTISEHALILACLEERQMKPLLHNANKPEPRSTLNDSQPEYHQ